MAAAKSNFFKDHYDWLVAIVGLALLAGVGVLFVTALDSSPEAARAACESEIKGRTPAHKDVSAADLTLLEKVRDGLEKPALLEPLSDKGGSFLASECRVFCQNPDRAACHKPIPYKSKVCPFCGFQQPSEESAEAVRSGVDADKDGLPDAWELKYGLNPNDPADAKQDPDGDTFTNFEEFEAKTDPKNQESHPEFLDFLATASALRTEELPFMFKMATPIPGGHRLTFVATKRNQDKKSVIGDAVVKSMATAEVGKEVIFELMKIRYVKGRAQDDKVSTGWRVLKYNKKEDLVLKPGTEQKVPVDVSTADLERISDKRKLSVQIGGRKPVAIEEQIDLVWNRGEGKKFTVTTGSEFTLANRKYKVKSLAKDGNACRVTIVDLEKNTEKIIQ